MGFVESRKASSFARLGRLALQLAWVHWWQQRRDQDLVLRPQPTEPIDRIAPQRGRSWSSTLRVERVTESVAQKIEPEDGDHDREAWKDREVRRELEILPALIQHHAP